MAAKYPNLFKNRYPTLSGRDWINSIEPEDRQAFIQLGLSAMDFGKLGGQATVQRYGKKHMKNIARVGAVVTNVRNYCSKAVEMETQRIAEEAHDSNSLNH